MKKIDFDSLQKVICFTTFEKSIVTIVKLGWEGVCLKYPNFSKIKLSKMAWGLGQVNFIHFSFDGDGSHNVFIFSGQSITKVHLKMIPNEHPIASPYHIRIVEKVHSKIVKMM